MLITTYDTTALAGDRKQEGREREKQPKFHSVTKKVGSSLIGLLPVFGFPAVIREPLTALITTTLISTNGPI